MQRWIAIQPIIGIQHIVNIAGIADILNIKNIQCLYAPLPWV